MAADLDLEFQRARMVDTQIAARGVKDPRVLAAMREVPRHLFVLADSRAHAYEDRPLAIGLGQTISQPFIVAAMTEALRPEPHHRVLEVGTGSGYQAAVLARLVSSVISIERHEALARQARAALDAAGIANVQVEVGDGSAGWPAGAPFDGIIVTAGAPDVPDTLKEQLGPGGRLVIPVGRGDHQVLTVVTRTADGFRAEAGESCVFVPLVGRYAWRG